MSHSAIPAAADPGTARSETAGLAADLRSIVEGEAWHGPALGELLRGVGAAQAAAHPIASAHSIWEIVLHVGAWQEIGRRRMHGEQVTVSRENDWPAPPLAADRTAWAETVEGLRRGAARLGAEMLELPTARLEETVRGTDHTVREMLRGVVEHGAYHAGQVALLKRALGVEPLAEVE
jgi:uncharacterized damage-inducible protein DinB